MDVYELENQSRFGMVPKLITRGVIDVEQPSYRTDYQILLILGVHFSEERFVHAHMSVRIVELPSISLLRSMMCCFESR